MWVNYQSYSRETEILANLRENEWAVKYKPQTHIHINKQKKKKQFCIKDKTLVVSKLLQRSFRSS